MMFDEIGPLIACRRQLWLPSPADKQPSTTRGGLIGLPVGVADCPCCASKNDNQVNIDLSSDGVQRTRFAQPGIRVALRQGGRLNRLGAIVYKNISEGARLMPVAAVVSTAIVLALGGCSTSFENTPVIPSHDTTIPASRTCGALGEALTISFNGVDGYQRGAISHDSYLQDLEQSKSLLTAIVAEPETAIAKTLGELISYIENAAPTAEGEPFDTSSAEYGAAINMLGRECEAAGSEIAIMAKYGG